MYFPLFLSIAYLANIHNNKNKVISESILFKILSLSLTSYRASLSEPQLPYLNDIRNVLHGACIKCNDTQIPHIVDNDK